jgi:AraC-like DNA-binding protein/mannose-6-phosphate isomerase-like protein (cupin superfamily)
MVLNGMVLYRVYMVKCKIYSAMEKLMRRGNMNTITEKTEMQLEGRQGLDLTVYHCGIEKCKPSHSFGPAIRDHFLIHYILEGQGTFYVDGNSHKLSVGQGFLICPNVKTYYEADHDKPWTYTWVGFNGVKAQAYLKEANLDRARPTFIFEDLTLIEGYFEAMRNTVEMKYGGELRLRGLLSIFLSELIERLGNGNVEGCNYKDNYIKKTVEYVEANYAREISISDIANYIGLNRNYFSSVIKSGLGITLQDFIIQFRVNKACELLKNLDLSISDISRSVGYKDPLCFSKVFKKIKGCSPKLYREGKLSSQNITLLSVNNE